MEAQFMKDLEIRTFELLSDLGPHADTVAPYWPTSCRRRGY